MSSLKRRVVLAAVGGLVVAGAVGAAASPAMAGNPSLPCPQYIANVIITSSQGGAVVGHENALIDVQGGNPYMYCVYYSPRIEEYTNGAAFNPVRVYSGTWGKWANDL